MGHDFAIGAVRDGEAFVGCDSIASPSTEQHWEKVEAEYAAILRRSAEREEAARQKWLAHAPYPPDLHEEERRFTPDQLVERFAQQHGFWLLTNNRNNEDETFLQATRQRENTPQALLVSLPRIETGFTKHPTGGKA